MKRKWSAESFFPAGFPWKPWRNYVIAGYLASIVFSCAYYLIRLWQQYQMLFTPFNGVKKLLPNVTMLDFKSIVLGSFAGFVIFIICMAFLAGISYRYHYQGSKSIYLMKRLPKKNELHRRCLALPAALIILSLATAFLLLAIDYQIYLSVTPKQCLVPGQWLNFWNQ